MPCTVRSILGDNYSFSAQVKHLSSTFREDRVKEAEKQLLILLFVKKLLKFVLFYESVLKITKMENISLYLLSIYIFYLPIYIFSVPVFLLSKSLTSLFLCFFSGSTLSKFLLFVAVVAVVVWFVPFVPPCLRSIYFPCGPGEIRT